MPIIHSDFGDVDLTVVTEGVITHLGTEIASFIGMDQNVAASKTITFDGGAKIVISTTGTRWGGTTIMYKPDGTSMGSSTYANSNRYHKCYVVCDDEQNYANWKGVWDYYAEGDEVSVGTSYTYASVFPQVPQPIYGNPVQLNGGRIFPVISPKIITENGIYDASLDGADGYTPVTVSVSGGTPVEPPLPVEYQEVEYMDFTPHCGYLVTIPTTFLLEAKFSPDAVETAHDALGYRTGSQDNKDFEIGIGETGLVRYWVRGLGQDADLTEQAVAGEVYVKRGMAYNFRTTAFIGRYAAYSSSTYFGFDGKIYYVKGWDINGNLSFKFVPCYRKADNTPGFYDVVADVFYSTLNTTGGGSIALGPDAN